MLVGLSLFRCVFSLIYFHKLNVQNIDAIKEKRNRLKATLLLSKNLRPAMFSQKKSMMQVLATNTFIRIPIYENCLPLVSARTGKPA